ncbi:hypothetical protein [Pseudarthrobacter oxydans]|uniref:hypothetical protein n=1 Tax=Pseudarthrobacter oxydans TaxID=1671 RepID=UPI0027D7BEC9|nr:hypothetical protein [Pseudarthrobacter oxydans]
MAYLGLVKAARAFDESKGTSFASFAAPSIKGSSSATCETGAGSSSPRGAFRTFALNSCVQNRNWPRPWAGIQVRRNWPGRWVLQSGPCRWQRRPHPVCVRITRCRRSTLRCSVEDRGAGGTGSHS